MKKQLLPVLAAVLLLRGGKNARIVEILNGYVKSVLESQHAGE